jgi:hypothetical protein
LSKLEVRENLSIGSIQGLLNLGILTNCE